MLTWMTVMCIDLYSTFSKAQLATNNPLSKFLLYLAFGWGVPSIMTIVVFLSQQLLPKESSFNPGIGQDFKYELWMDAYASKCFLSPSSEKIWFYIPMLVLLSINTGVYMIMIFKLAIAKWETRNVRLSTNQILSTNSDIAQQLIFFLKLFIVLGILWICDCLHRFIHKDKEDHDVSAEYFFQAIDVLILLRGFFFFVIFIMKKSVLIKLKRYFKCNQRQNIQGRGNTSSQTSTKSYQTMSSVMSKSSKTSFLRKPDNQVRC